MFVPLENNKPFAKVALEGFAGDGKTYTAVQIAMGIHKLINSKKPIAVFDTEKALKALKHEFDKNNIQVVTAQNRTLASLVEAMKWCEAGNADILIIDSITHVWENYIENYKNEKKRTALQFQDWGIVKPKWKKEFSDYFVNCNVHIIFTGRAGYEYTQEKNERGNMEIYKSGIKMKAENETAFEPDLLILMERDFDLISEKKTMVRKATIIKDRTTKIDGKEFTNPTFDNFYPAISVLLDGELKSIHGQDIPDTFQDFEEKFSLIGKQKDIYIAEIEGCFKLIGLGTGAEAQKAKTWLLDKTFGVKSVEALKQKDLKQLERGSKVLAQFSENYSTYLQECVDMQTNPDPQRFKEIYQNAEMLF